jgi:hypothetical protein
MALQLTTTDSHGVEHQAAYMRIEYVGLSKVQPDSIMLRTYADSAKTDRAPIIHVQHTSDSLAELAGVEAADAYSMARDAFLAACYALYKAAGVETETVDV